MRRDITFAVIGALIVAAVTWGLSTWRPSSSAIPEPSHPFTPSPVKPADEDKVVMHVNGEPVTLAEFNAFVAQAPEQMQSVYASPQGRAMLAQEIAKLKALQQEGQRMGVENDPQVKLRIEMAKENIIAGTALQKMVPTPTDQRLRAEYEKEKKNLETTELSHILIAYQGGSVPPRAGQPLPLAEAMKKADAVYARLKSGAPFEQMAAQVSDDNGSANAGGRLGPVSPGSLPPELDAAVSTLKPGELSKPVKSAFGIHIFKMGPREARQFDEVKPMFAAKLQREEMEAAVTKLQKQAKVDLDPKFFPPEFREQPGAPRPVPAAPKGKQ